MIRLVTQSPGWLRSNLFLPTPSGPLGWRKITLAVACVIVGAAVSLSRTEGPGSLNTVWLEDAKDMLSQALYLPLSETVGIPIGGYYHVPARIITQIAIQFPLAWSPGVMSVFAALLYAVTGLVAYIASGPFLRSGWMQVLVAVPVVMLPLAYTQSDNDLATVQFVGLYGAFWVLLWRPGTRGGKIAAPTVMFTVSFETPLVLVLAPLVLARLIADRSKTAISVALVWFLGTLLEFSLLLEGPDRNQIRSDNSVLWVAERYGTRVLPRALFGEKALGGPGTDVDGNYAPLHIVSMDGHIALICAAWAVMGLAIVFGWTRLTAANWPLIVVAALFSVAFFFEEIFFNIHVVQPRYTIVPAMLCYLVLVAALRPRVKPGTETVRKLLRCLPVTGLAVLLAVAVIVNFRVANGRSSSQPWSSVVAEAKASCQGQPQAEYYHFAHEWWQVNIPCSDFRDYWEVMPQRR